MLVRSTKRATPGRRLSDMKMKWVCIPCGYVYDEEKGDPERGIKPGTRFEKLPENWVCPVCGAGKNLFKKHEDK